MPRRPLPGRVCLHTREGRYHRSGPPVRHKLQGFEDRLRSLFEQDQKRERRERRTAVKLYEQLVTEGYTGSYSPVCRFVKALKADGSELLHAFIPLHFKAGDALQFDWSEEHVILGGVDQKIIPYGESYCFHLSVSELRIFVSVIAANLLSWLIQVNLRRWFWMHLCVHWRFMGGCRVG